MPITPPKVEHINPFLKATVHSFATMMSVEANPSKPYLKQGSGINYDISGVIGLSGEAKGSIVISFPKDTAMRVIKAFVGEEPKELDSDVSDAVGEIVNIIAGSAKKDLVDFQLDISLPTVVLGDQHNIVEPKDVLSMIIPFDSDVGTFDVAVNLKTEN